MLKEAVQTSYQKGAQQAGLTAKVSRQTVKNKIYSLKFLADEKIPKNKKKVDYLYIDADEDLVALQFREKKGDLVKAENGMKNNGLITKLVYIYEGKENKTYQSRRRVLMNPRYFCGVSSGEVNLKFWENIRHYLERNYELRNVKRIYLNTDGGSWIKAEMKQLEGITYVLDGFHLEKYFMKLVSHIKKEKRIPELEELRRTIREKTKADFKELVEEKKRNAKMEKLEEGGGSSGIYPVKLDSSQGTSETEEWGTGEQYRRPREQYSFSQNEFKADGME